MIGNQYKKTSTYLYALSLGVNIKDTLEEVENLSLQSNQETDFLTDYKVTLNGVKFTRKVYQPGKIEAELIVGNKKDGGANPSVKAITDCFLHRLANLSVIERTTDEEQVVAQNYYVYEVNPQLVMQANNKPVMVVKLTMYSMDKLMALDKYSKAFVAAKLGAGILESESQLFGFKNSLLKTDYKNLQNLLYDSGKREMIHPYLVQYNETFYDFLARTANRCGEFLFFEDGQLVLGLPNVSDNPNEITDYVSVTVQSISDHPLDVSIYYRDSMKDDNGEMKGLNFEEKEKDDAGFPEDAFPEKMSYNAEVAYDEYLYPLKSREWSTVWREMGVEDGERIGLSVGLSLLTNYVSNTKTSKVSGLIDIGIGLGKEWGALAASTAMLFIPGVEKLMGGPQSTGDKKYITPIQEKDKAKEQTSNDKVVQFGSLNDSGWPTLKFFSDNRKHEEEQQKQMICIDMGTGFIPVKMGEKISVAGLEGTYVVVEIRQVANEKWTRDYKTYGSENGSDKYTDKQSQVIYAIPMFTNGAKQEKAVPPVLQAPYIRTAGPQTALVVDSEDPKYQGRVRIAYPWQSVTEAARLALVEVSNGCKEVTARKKAAEKYLSELRESRRWLERLEEKLLELIADPIRLKAELDEVTAGLVKIEKRKAELNAEEAEDKGKEETPALLLRKEKREAERKKLDAQEEWLRMLGDMLGESEPTKLTEKLNKLKQKISDQETAVTAVRDELEKTEKEEAAKLTELKSAKDKWTNELKDIASPWVRVATPMATNGGGVYFKPQVGDEVLVNYDNDNVERPYVVGSLFSKDVITPEEGLTRNFNAKPATTALKMGATASIMSPNGHQVTFKDTPDGTAFAEKIQGGLTKIVSMAGYDFGVLKDLTGGIFIGDRWGLYEISMSAHSREINISSPLGTVSIDAFTGISIEAPNGDISIVGKNINIEAGNNLTITSGTNIQEEDPSGTGGQKAGAFFGGIAFGSVAGVVDVMGMKFLDMRFIRHMTEVMLRPIEGTMCIKSNRYMMLEAGNGNACLPVSRFDEEDEAVSQQKFFNNLIDCVNAISQKMNLFLESYESAWKTARSQKRMFDIWVGLSVAEGKLTDLNPVKKALALDVNAAWADQYTEADFKDDDFKAVSARSKTTMTEAANGCAKAVFELRKVVEKQFKELFEDYKHNPEADATPMDNILKEAWNKKCADKIDKWKSCYFSNGDAKDDFLKDLDTVNEEPFVGGNKAKKFKRMLAIYFIAKVAESDDYKKKSTEIKADTKLGTVKNLLGAVGNFLADPSATMKGKGQYLDIHFNPDEVEEDKLETDYNWIHFIRRMQKPSNYVARKLYDAIVGTAQQYLQTEEFAQIADREVWNNRGDGQLLISTEEGKTHEFADGNWQASTKDNNGSFEALQRALKAIR